MICFTSCTSFTIDEKIFLFLLRSQEGNYRAGNGCNRRGFEEYTPKDDTKAIKIKSKI